ncbi:MAG: hypothetical protein MI673_08270, partial [Thiotrichales bacterium]|nr:hypothetical protein [Thiotrichales bacterium]
MLLSAHEKFHPLNITELDWPSENVSRVLANVLDIQGGAPIISWTELGRVVKIDDKLCLVGPLFMFDIDDSFAFNIDETITMELLFDRTKSNGFIVSYDHAAYTPVAETVNFDRTKAARWHREIISLDRAGFANRKLASTDLSIAAPGALMPYDPDKQHEIALCELK